ncbi:MAG: 1-deoxy-D-xylulose-5-phosphate synthase [Planctomycetota bacterium]|jgi:1-deoxy-D-xylulose-5-phosphate synthase
MNKLLENINCPQDLQALSIEQLAQLAEELREFITHSVSQTGGHLASNLGMVDMTIAMHRVFDFSKDRLLWDVGHQCYAHKVLTGRRNMFSGLRQEAGLSGFPCPEESAHDVFKVGHAGTSVATALGLALGAQHKQTDEKVVALVGDASIFNGLSFEALNSLSLLKRQMLIVLNDNSMAIDVTQGAMAKFLSKVRLSHTYEDIRNTTNNILEHVPLIGKRMENALENFKKTLRMTNCPSRLFESLDIPYFGPVDGHDIESLVELFGAIKDLHGPAILHVYTKKGKGYEPAATNPSKFHGTGPFEVNGDCVGNKTSGRSFTAAFGDALTEQGKKDDRLIAITAAMPDGTGLTKFRQEFADRYYDVGIAESVAIDLAAGMAKQGLRPVVCIYSTFLQRGIDQIFQEVVLQNLPVTFCLDRAGLVGNDGPTHHGMLDISYMRMFPNMVIAAPADEFEIQQALDMATGGDKPFAIRYPRDSVTVIEGNDAAYEFGKAAVVRKGDSDIVLCTIGPILTEALAAADTLAAEGIDVTVVNARFAKPIDSAIIELMAQGKTVIFAEDNSVTGGFGSAVIEQALETARQTNDQTLRNSIGKAILLGGPDKFVPVATRKRQLNWLGIDAEKLAETVKSVKFSSEKADIIETEK